MNNKQVPRYKTPQLIVATPSYSTDSGALEQLYNEMENASGLTLLNLSGLPLPAFNHSVLSSTGEQAFFTLNAAMGLEKHDFWAKALACLAGIPHIILAIDNMAQVDWSQERFEELKEEYSDHAAGFDCNRLSVLPIDLASGENIRQPSAKLSWHKAPPLLTLLNEQDIDTPSPVKSASEESSDQFAVHLCWTARDIMLPGRLYRLKSQGGKAEAHISTLKHRLNPETLEHQAAKKLFPGDIGYCNISLDDTISFTPFAQNRDCGRFTLHDQLTDEPVALGLIKHPLHRATNIKWHVLDVDKKARAAGKKQKPCALWFTGLSGSGKSSVASLVDKKLHAMGLHTYVLDGDNVRHGLCRDLGFTDVDRVENLRRISETSKLFVDAGLIVLVSFISPFRAERQAARDLFDNGEFLEVFVNAPLEVCEARDPKGLYKMARAGTLKNFTGIDSAYEAPENAEIDLPAGEATVEQLADIVITEMTRRGLVKYPEA